MGSKQKRITYRTKVDARKTHQNENDDRKIASVFVRSVRIEFNFGHNVQFYRFERFSVESRKRIETVGWTRIDRCVFDENGNAYFWKRPSVDGQDLIQGYTNNTLTFSPAQSAVLLCMQGSVLIHLWFVKGEIQPRES